MQQERFGRFITYLRVSTARQGDSGLGLEAQRAAVERYVGKGKYAQVLHEYVEVESGKRDDRPQLAAALAHAKRLNATLLVAKLDRLSRSASFLLRLVEGKVPVKFADMPDIAGAPGKLMLTIMAGVAELERAMISDRTKQALAARKARGEVVGSIANLRPNHEAISARAQAFAEEMRPTITAFVTAGMTQRAIVQALNSMGKTTATGGHWTQAHVQRVLHRLDARTTGRPGAKRRPTIVT
jgi:DNA invertase Pin-like site-specific DNA recombinase